MAVLSMEERARILRSQGFPEEQIPRMVAISEAESGGNIRAHNPNASTGDNSYGLFQVNMLGGMGPERRKQFGLQSNDELFDPATNARVAKGILASQGFDAWSVNRSGAADKFMAQAQEAARRTAGQSSSTSTTQGPATRPAARTAEPSNPFAAIGLAGLTGLIPSGDSAPKAEPRMAQSDQFGAQLAKLAGSMMEFDEKEAARGESTAAGGRGRRGSSDVPDLPDVPDIGSVGLAAIRKLGGTEKPSPAEAPSAAGAATAATTQAPTPRSGAEGSMDLLSFKRTLRDGTGLKFAENAHPEFGGKVGGHSQGSLHYQNMTLPDGSQVSRAVDITDWRRPGEPESVWKPRKAELERSWQSVASRYPGVFQIIGPDSDPGGHGQHIHFGVLADQVPAAAAQEFLAAEAEVRRRFPLRG